MKVDRGGCGCLQLRIGAKGAALLLFLLVSWCIIFQTKMLSSIRFVSLDIRWSSPPCNASKVGNHTYWSMPPTQHLFVGPGIDNSTASNFSRYAVCSFLGEDNPYHFPHGMRQLYRCWSWWEMHPSKIKVLEVPRDFWDDLKRQGGGRVNPFFRGILRVFTNGLNVTVIVSNSTAAPVKDLASVNAINVSEEEVTAVWVEYNQNIYLGRMRKYYAFRRGDSSTLRDGVVSYYFPDRNPSICQKAVKVGILNRRGTRRILNVDVLSKVLSNYSSRVVYFEGATFQEQVDFFSSVDVLVSPHGAQLTGEVFMPKCGAVLELIPRGYFAPNWFGSLAVDSGLNYSYLYMSEGDPLEESRNISATKSGRTWARKQNFCLPIPAVVEAVKTLIEQWHSCCEL